MNNSVLEKSPNPQVSETALKMPNLFVIGASKSGSSALHAYLKVHPEIAMSLEKEPCYFIDQQELTEMWPIMARPAEHHNPPHAHGRSEGWRNAPLFGAPHSGPRQGIFR